MDLANLAALATIGAFILSGISLFLELQNRAKEQPPDPTRQRNRRRILLTFGGGLILAVLGIAVYWLAIIFATFSPGTPTDIVSRSTVWATLLGMIVGTIWSLLVLPFLIRSNMGN